VNRWIFFGGEFFPFCEKKIERKSLANSLFMKKKSAKKENNNYDD
jgi:hypothetical protein